MQSSRPLPPVSRPARLARLLASLLAALLALALVSAPALAQDDDDDYEEDDYDEYAYDEPEELELRGIASASYVHSFQDTKLGGGSFDDGNGSEVMAGFTAGKYWAFLLSWEWQTASGYDTHFIPLNVRMMSPSILDRARLYGQFGIGLFFSQLGGRFDRAGDENERGSAVRVGGGMEVGITDDVSAVAFGNYLWGLGSTDDYEYATVGVGLQYRWDF